MSKQITLSRRGFLGATAATAAAAVTPVRLFAAAKPNSKVNGVQIGVINYSYHGQGQSAEQVLSYLLENGLSSVELMRNAINPFIKTPSIGGSVDPANNDKWLAAAEDKDIMAKCAELRKMYADAGVTIHTTKFDDIGDGKLTDGQNEYYFKVTKALGAKAITREVDKSGNISKRIGDMADKHKIYVAFHNHEQIDAKTYDDPKILSNQYLSINLDIGHYTAANSDCVVEIVEKYNKRITSLHIKDRKTKADGGANMPFGEGGTPIVDVLKLMRKNKYTFPADIELEYKPPEGSNTIKEVTKCADYCKKALA
ncbi:MAG: sugar phosphate isomerase/epimerase [Kiritimatiellaeota bacterium]|nr:sugar phosphate isomerase/epimerase [Kiritimatiellota bacterium]